MDRSDELKDRPAEDGRDTGEDIKRDGDVLALGGSPVPKSTGDPTTEHGATGIDIGGGGHGTDVAQD